MRGLVCKVDGSGTWADASGKPRRAEDLLGQEARPKESSRTVIAAHREGKTRPCSGQSPPSPGAIVIQGLRVATGHGAVRPRRPVRASRCWRGSVAFRKAGVRTDCNWRRLRDGHTRGDRPTDGKVGSTQQSSPLRGAR